MAHLIDKSALVAEIERLEKINQEYKKTWKWKFKWFYRTIIGRLEVLEGLKEFIDTLEVKEVKNETVSDDLGEAIGQSFIYHESHGDDFRSDKQIETAYIRGFETCAKWLINKHSIEVKEVDLNKEIKDYFDNQPIITRSKGVDYQLIPSGEDIAKHFFELGLNSRHES